MTPAALAELVRDTAMEVVRDKGLDVSALPREVSVTRPRNPAHGDFATNLPLQAAAGLGVTPLQLARWLSAALGATAPVVHAEAAEPGFVNLRLAAVAHAEQLAEALRACVEQPPLGLPAPDPRLVAEIGADAASYARLWSDVDTSRFLRQTEQNPVFVWQYAHSRLAAALRNAAELGITVDDAPAESDLPLLSEETAVELSRAVADYPRVLRVSAEQQQPQRLARYLDALVTAYYRFAEVHRILPLGDEAPRRMNTARLALCATTRQVLAHGLGLLGIAAPERI